MHRLFLDANVMFSAAWRENAGLQALWKLKYVTLCSSRYALEEARVNLTETAQLERLDRLSRKLELSDALAERLPEGIRLPGKDAPILLAAIEAKATHLITGDLRHFGMYFGRTIEGVMIVTPGEYLRNHGGTH